MLDIEGMRVHHLSCAVYHSAAALVPETYSKAQESSDEDDGAGEESSGDDEDEELAPVPANTDTEKAGLLTVSAHILLYS